MAASGFFSSPLRHGTVDLKLAKKKQTLIKNTVGSFVKLMISWKQDVCQIATLLHNLQSLVSTAESVQRVQSRHSQPYAIFDELFPEVYSLLTGKLYEEIEAVYHQLKRYIVGLGDVVMAIRMMEKEIYSLIKDENVEMFTIDGLDVIFTADHVLSMQQLTNSYILEYERKQEIVKGVISCTSVGILSSEEIDDGRNSRGENKASTNSNKCLSTDPPWLSRKEIDDVITIWSDDSQESYIETEEVENFVLINGGNIAATQD